MEVKVDQSWAWVVLAAAFGIQFISGSLQYSSGIIRLTLLQNAVPEEKTFITWIISLYASLFSGAAILGSLLIYKLGCRKAMFIGCSLQTIGFIGSYIVIDVKILLLTLSIIAATGSGICYGIAMVVISYHFDRYLGLASGIAVSAQGFGTMTIFAIEIGVDFYGLRNFFLLMAGYVLQNFVFGALLRPSVHEHNHSKKVKNVKIVTGKDNIVYESDEFNKEKKLKSENLTIHITVPQNSSNKLHQHEIQSEPENLYKPIDKTNNNLDQLSVDPNEGKSTVEIKTTDNLDSVDPNEGKSTVEIKTTDNLDSVDPNEGKSTVEIKTTDNLDSVDPNEGKSTVEIKTTDNLDSVDPNEGKFTVEIKTTDNLDSVDPNEGKSTVEIKTTDNLDSVDPNEGKSTVEIKTTDNFDSVDPNEGKFTVEIKTTDNFDSVDPNEGKSTVEIKTTDNLDSVDPNEGKSTVEIKTTDNLDSVDPNEGKFTVEIKTTDNLDSVDPNEGKSTVEIKTTDNLDSVDPNEGKFTVEIKTTDNLDSVDPNEGKFTVEIKTTDNLDSVDPNEGKFTVEIKTTDNLDSVDPNEGKSTVEIKTTDNFDSVDPNEGKSTVEIKTTDNFDSVDPNEGKSTVEIKTTDNLDSVDPNEGKSTVEIKTTDNFDSVDPNEGKSTVEIKTTDNFDSVDPNEGKSTVEIKTTDNFDSQHAQSLDAQEISVNELLSNKFTKENGLQKPSLVSNCSEKETCFEGYKKILKNYKFILLILFIAFFSSAEGICYILLPSYFIEKGSTKTQVSLMFSFIGIASTLSRFLTGLILNKNLLSLTVLFSVPSFLLAVCSYCVPYFIHIYWGQLTYCLLFGVLNFTVYVLINKTCIHIVGLQGTAASIGLIMFVSGVAALLGSPLSEKIVLWTGSSDSVTAVVGTLYLMASIVIIPATYRL